MPRTKILGTTGPTLASIIVRPLSHEILLQASSILVYPEEPGIDHIADFPSGTEIAALATIDHTWTDLPAEYWLDLPTTPQGLSLLYLI